MEVTYKGKNYAIKTNLRVAYIIQGQHNHKPYADVFQSVGDMPVEQQIAIVYAGFAAANPDEAKIITREAFTDDFLDNNDVSVLMELLQGIIEGIMGESLTKKAAPITGVEVKTEQGNA